MKALTNIRPNFLVIGAPRCGTTSLHDMPGRHPDIFMSAIKEPHYFSSIDFPFPENDILRITKDTADYQALFAGAAASQLCGESSSYYLSDPTAPARIKAYNPDMKLIAILREPVQRAYSHYLLYDRRGKQARSFTETVEQLMGGTSESPVYDVVGIGNYGEQLAQYYQHFPKEQLLIVMFDDFTKHPTETLERILEFLGVDSSSAAEMANAEPQNQYQVPRSQALAKLANNRVIMKMLLKVVPRPLVRAARNTILLKKDSGKKEPIDPATAAKLKTFYANDEAELATLLGTTASQLWR